MRLCRGIGINDQVPQHATKNAIQSFWYLMRPQSLAFFHTPRQRSQICTRFLFNNKAYRFAVADA